jgi:hypothetical protein
MLRDTAPPAMCLFNGSQRASTHWSAAGTSETQPDVLVASLCLALLLSCLENGNRYEGIWERGMKNGHGRFFHLDHGQLFEGYWVDNVAKCGTMIDFGRDEAPEPTQFPIPKVGSPPGALKPEKQKPASKLGVVAHAFKSQHSGGRGRRISVFEASLVYRVSSRIARATQRNPVSKNQTNKQKGKKRKETCNERTRDEVLFSSNQPAPQHLPPTFIQVEILDPDGVLKEALDKLMKPEEEEG